MRGMMAFGALGRQQLLGYSQRVQPLIKCAEVVSWWQQCSLTPLFSLGVCPPFSLLPWGHCVVAGIIGHAGCLMVGWMADAIFVP
jgi:hypothetical protein